MTVTLDIPEALAGLLLRTHPTLSRDILEAFAAELPCVISDIPAHRDVVAVCGAALMFDPGSPNALTECLHRLFDNPAIEQEMVQAGVRLCEDYTPAAMAERYRTFYADVLGLKLPANRRW